MTAPEDIVRRLGYETPAARIERLTIALHEAQTTIDALTAERDALTAAGDRVAGHLARCGECGGDLRPVCVECGTRHGYGWPDLPEPS